MLNTSVEHIKKGDAIETPSGIFIVTDTALGLGGTVLLRGRVGLNFSEWAVYQEGATFQVVTIH